MYLRTPSVASYVTCTTVLVADRLLRGLMEAQTARYTGIELYEQAVKLILKRPRGPGRDDATPAVVHQTAPRRAWPARHIREILNGETGNHT